jgi:hypothetical protein
MVDCQHFLIRLRSHCIYDDRNSHHQSFFVSWYKGVTGAALFKSICPSTPYDEHIQLLVNIVPSERLCFELTSRQYIARCHAVKCALASARREERKRVEIMEQRRGRKRRVRPEAQAFGSTGGKRERDGCRTRRAWWL